MDLEPTQRRAIRALLFAFATLRILARKRGSTQGPEMLRTVTPPSRDLVGIKRLTHLTSDGATFKGKESSRVVSLSERLESARRSLPTLLRFQ